MYGIYYNFVFGLSVLKKFWLDYCTYSFSIVLKLEKQMLGTKWYLETLLEESFEYDVYRG